MPRCRFLVAFGSVWSLILSLGIRPGADKTRISSPLGVGGKIRDPIDRIEPKGTSGWVSFGKRNPRPLSKGVHPSNRVSRTPTRKSRLLLGIPRRYLSSWTSPFPTTERAIPDEDALDSPTNLRPVAFLHLFLLLKSIPVPLDRNRKWVGFEGAFGKAVARRSVGGDGQLRQRHLRHKTRRWRVQQHVHAHQRRQRCLWRQPCSWNAWCWERKDDEAVHE